MPYKKGDNQGSQNAKWRGGRYTDNTFGYVFVRKPGHPNADHRGYVREHIFLMSEHLGRPIAPNEVVHHINGIRDDNRLENLQVMTRHAHNTHHHKHVMKPASLKNLDKRPYKPKPLKTCDHCGTKFYRRGTPRHTYSYCSHACYIAHRFRDRY